MLPIAVVDPSSSREARPGSSLPMTVDREAELASGRANHRVNVNWPLFMAPPQDTVDIIPDIIPDILPE